MLSSLFEMGQKREAQAAQNNGIRLSQRSEPGQQAEIPGLAVVVRFLRVSSVRSVGHRVRWRTAGLVPAVQ